MRFSLGRLVVLLSMLAFIPIVHVSASEVDDDEGGDVEDPLPELETPRFRNFVGDPVNDALASYLEMSRQSYDEFEEKQMQQVLRTIRSNTDKARLILELEYDDTPKDETQYREVLVGMLGNLKTASTLGFLVSLVWSDYPVETSDPAIDGPLDEDGRILEPVSAADAEDTIRTVAIDGIRKLARIGVDGAGKALLKIAIEHPRESLQLEAIGSVLHEAPDVGDAFEKLRSEMGDTPLLDVVFLDEEELKTMITLLYLVDEGDD